jgi:hypothetical protein
MVRSYEDDQSRVDSTLAWLGWSAPFGRLFGTELRLSWTLLVTMVFESIRIGQKLLLPHLIPLAIILPVVLVLAHALGRVLAARLCGARVSRSMLWALGDMSQIDAPIRPGPQFIVAVGGLVVSLAIWIGTQAAMNALCPGWHFTIMYVFTAYSAGAAAGWSSAGWLGAIVGFTCIMSFDLLFWNLLPSVLFDGGRLWRAALWPVLGLPRAVRVAVIGSFVASLAMIALGLYMTDLMFFVFGLMMLFASINELRAARMGYDLVLGIEPISASAYARDGSRKPGWLARWREKRRLRRLERIEREEASEQEVLDRLLAKVSAQGLPSLTAGERAELHRISEKQKKRLERA